MVFVLDGTNKSLKFTITAGAGADVHFTSHWADATTSGLTEGQTQGTSNGSTTVDAVASPAASTRRVVKLITFHNTSSTTSCTVTLVNDVGGTSRTIAVFTLAPLATWYSDTAATTAIADITSGNLLGRTSAGLGPVQQITPGTGVLAWLQTPTADNLRSAVTGDTGTGNLVFADAPTLTNVTVSSGNLLFSGQGQALRGEMSGGLSDRFYLQTSAANNLSGLNILPSASSSTNSNFQFFDRNDFVNNNRLVLSSNSATGLSLINSLAIGSATGVPLALATSSVNRIIIEQNGNIGINGNSYGASSVGVIGIANATTIPTGNPTNGGVLYVEAGALKYRGSSGTITTLGNA